jgi:hypothetical protein
MDQTDGKPSAKHAGGPVELGGVGSMFKNEPAKYFLLLLLTAAVPLFAEDSVKTAISVKDSSPQSTVQDKPNPYKDADISIKIIPSANKTYGYDILLYKRPLVHQPNIPGLPGNEGFTTQEGAQTVAEFVVKKIRDNEMPLTVTIEELNKIVALKWRYMIEETIGV